MPWRSVLNDLAATVFVMAAAIGMLALDRNLPDPPTMTAPDPPPKMIIIDPPTKHEPRLVVTNTGKEPTR